MARPAGNPAEVAARARAALESADLAQLQDLLDPHVCWGAPDDPAPPCRNRDQVLAWFRQGHDDGVSLRVTEVSIHANKILIGMKVAGRSEQGAGELDRWQLLTVAEGKVVDIRGFGDRAQAAHRLLPESA